MIRYQVPRAKRDTRGGSKGDVGRVMVAGDVTKKNRNVVVVILTIEEGVALLFT